MPDHNSYERKMISTDNGVMTACTQRATDLGHALDQEMEWFSRRWDEVAVLKITLMGV